MVNDSFVIVRNEMGRKLLSIREEVVDQCLCMLIYNGKNNLILNPNLSIIKVETRTNDGWRIANSIVSSDNCFLRSFSLYWKDTQNGRS